MTGGVLCVGRNSVDYIFSVDLGHVRPDAKQRTGDPAIFVGGQCVNAAVTLAALGAPVAYAGVVGDDASGERVTGFLASRGIDCRAVEHAPQMANASAYILVDRTSGERSIVETAAVAWPAYGASVPEEVWAAISHVYFDGHETVASLAIAREAARRGIPTLTDAEVVTTDSLALLRSVDTAIVPKSVAAEIAGSDAPETMLAALAALGVRRSVVTMGADGAIGALERQEIVTVPAEKCQVIDTTGAGDAFHAGFLRADMGGASFEQALVFATRVAALACSIPGPSAGPAALAGLAAAASRGTWTS